MAERHQRRGVAPVHLVLTRRALEDPIHGQCGVCFERHRLEHLVVLGADELAICRNGYEAAARFSRLSGDQPTVALLLATHLLRPIGNPLPRYPGGFVMSFTLTQACTMLPEEAGIYAIFNRRLRRVYVGETSNLRKRFAAAYPRGHAAWFAAMYAGRADEVHNGRVLSSRYCADAASYPSSDFEVIELDRESLNRRLRSKRSRLHTERWWQEHLPRQWGYRTYNGREA